MQTIKTGVVVALLLAVCYGAIVALNAPAPEIPDEVLSEFDWSGDATDLEGLMSIEMPAGEPVANWENGSGPGATSPDGGLPPIDTSGLSIPTLPGLDGVGVGAALDSTAAGGVAGLPSLPDPLAATAPPAGSPSSSAASAGADVPEFPAVPGLDGPAVSLPTAGGPASTDSQNSPASTLPAPPTQLVSQSSAAASDPSLALPILDAEAEGKTDTTNATSASPQTATSQASMPTVPFAAGREQALALAHQGKLRDALEMLSAYYGHPELSHAEHQDLIDILDSLAREVVYSDRHLVEPPYVVAAGDTVESVAAKFQITPELFHSINRLGESKALVPGTKVKVLQGPFRADVSLNRGELTVFVGKLYAGRFAISLGKDPAPFEGSFEIAARRRDRTYYGTGGNVIDAGDPRNPYGGYWLNLGVKDLCIHGTPEMVTGELEEAGCISLAPIDAADAYKILAEGSHVVIRR